MITHVIQPLGILLRKRLPQTKEDWLMLFAIVVLMTIYYLFKEKVLSRNIKWIFSGALLLGSTIALLITQSRGEKFFFWCLSGAFFYCIMFELAKGITFRGRGIYYPPGEEPSKKDLQLTDEEELDINKIVLFLLVVWLIAGFFITPKIPSPFYPQKSLIF